MAYGVYAGYNLLNKYDIYSGGQVGNIIYSHS